jgi:hypothetical protein
MRSLLASAAVGVMVIACANRPERASDSVRLSSRLETSPGASSDPDVLRSPEAFAAIKDKRERSIALFVEMSKVLMSPRCVNCHPRNDRPLQGDAQVPHVPPVSRGADGHGVPGLPCATCHAQRSAPFASGAGSMPGNPKWGLAPIEMGWEGKSSAEICSQIKDPTRNGGMSLAQIEHHHAEDELVAYGWDPGPGRKKAPGTQTVFGALTRAWVESGAHCP